MKLAILYATRYGSTRLAAEAVARGVEDRGVPGAQITVEDIRKSTDLPDAETVVIGAPIYGGSIPRFAARFLDTHLAELLERRVALFLSCLYDGARAEQQLADNFPGLLVAHSFGHYFVGGRVAMERLKWLDRYLMKRVGGVDHDVDTMHPEEIERLIGDLVLDPAST